jgi:UDP-N-acetylglucosamine 2-epimerase (non-hydrolysing)
MKKESKYIIVFGTRPEFIKLIPLFVLIGKRNIKDKFLTIFTGQHENISSELPGFYHFEFDYTLQFRNHNNSILDSFNSINKELNMLFLDIANNYQIEYVIGQGDTTSCVSAAFTAFLNNIPFAHIEAGLRTQDFQNPFPEEYFRRIITLSTVIHFAPTRLAYNNLINENIPASKILITGNTIIDSIKLVQENVKQTEINKFVRIGRRNVLITCHRRENQPSVFEKLIFKTKELAASYIDIDFIWILHPNPVLEQLISKQNSAMELENFRFIPPCPFHVMINLYSQINLIITDSGGIQEEASYFGIPIIIIRSITERAESVDCGIAHLINPELEGFKETFIKYINEPIKKYPELYGDGNASKRILDYLINDEECI